MLGRHVAGIDICLWCIFCIPISFGSALTQLTTASPWQFISHYRARAAQRNWKPQKVFCWLKLCHTGDLCWMWFPRPCQSWPLTTFLVGSVEWMLQTCAGEGTNSWGWCGRQAHLYASGLQRASGECSIKVTNRWALSSPDVMTWLIYEHFLEGQGRPYQDHQHSANWWCFAHHQEGRVGRFFFFMKGQDGPLSLSHRCWSSSGSLPFLS